jgi:hypothetical protein
MKRGDQRQETVTEIALSIEKMAGDDEILSKIVLSYLREVRRMLDVGIIPDDSFFKGIFISHWPYSADPPSLDDFEKTEKLPEIVTPHPEIGINERMYLNEIQKQLGRKVKGGELFSFCKELAHKAELRFAKKVQISKGRALSWMVENSHEIEVYFSDLLATWVAKQQRAGN